MTPRKSHRPSKPRLARLRVDWLSRALSRGGLMPLEEAEDAIRAGRVSVDGRVVHQPMTVVSPTSRLKIDGHPVQVESVRHVLAFHKPAGVITAQEDRHGDGTVFERLGSVLAPELQTFQWHAVGRLDRDTTGLLLFTNDEQVVARVTSPSSLIEKVYRAKVGGALKDSRLQPLRDGMDLEDGPARAVSVRILGPGEVELVLTEGRNHQAKRMLGAVGLPVMALQRVRIGSVVLDVEEGQYRPVTATELAGLEISAISQ